MKNARDFWNKAAQRYARSPIKDEKTYQQKLAITREYLHPDSEVLEFGCGTGGTAIAHAPYVRSIVATDISDRMLEIARGKADQAGVGNIAFRQGTLDTLDLPPGRFDAVLGLNVLHLIEDVDAAVARVSDLLKPGGVFVSSTSLVGEISFLWRWLIAAMQALGLAPHVSRLDRQGLLSILAGAGFAVDHTWQPTRESIFIVARKPGPPA